MQAQLMSSCAGINPVASNAGINKQAEGRAHSVSVMKLRYRLIILVFGATAIGSILWSANYYHGKYQLEKTRADTAEQRLRLANASITDMQIRQRDVAALDAKYTQELTDAQTTISNLRKDVDDGKRRLQLNATCTQSNATAPRSLGNTTAPDL